MTTLAIMIGLLVTPALAGALLNRWTGRSVANVNQLGCVGIALLFVFTGIGHFLLTEPMATMLPSWVPWRVSIVYVSGIIEFMAAIAVLIPRMQRPVGWGLIVMLLLFLPINVYAAVNRVELGGHEWGPIYLLIRVPHQLFIIAWIWWMAVRPAWQSGSNLAEG